MLERAILFHVKILLTQRIKSMILGDHLWLVPGEDVFLGLETSNPRLRHIMKSVLLE